MLSGSNPTLHLTQGSSSESLHVEQSKPSDSGELQLFLSNKDDTNDVEHRPDEIPLIDRDGDLSPEGNVLPKVGFRPNSAPMAVTEDLSNPGSPAHAAATPSSSHQAVPDETAPKNDSNISKIAQGDSILEARPIKAIETLPMDENKVAMMFHLTGKTAGPSADDHTFQFSSDSGREKTIARDLEGRYRLSIESGDMSDPTKDKIHIGYIPFYAPAKSPHVASQNPIPIEFDPENNQYFMNIDFQKKAYHVAAYLSPIPTSTGVKVSLSMTRVSGLPEKPSPTSENNPSEAKDKEASASGSQPDVTGSKVASEDDIVELPKAPETDVEEPRNDSSLFSCCGFTGIRERMTKHHPAAGT